MLGRRKQGLSQDEKAEALEQLFPTAGDPDKLTMVTRTPSHMIMPLVRLAVISAALEAAKAQSERVYKYLRRAKWENGKIVGIKPEAEMEGEGGKDYPEDNELGLVTNFVPITDITPADYKRLLEDPDEPNLLEVFRREWDRRMISKDGKGREEMLEILGKSAETEDSLEGSL